jgi:predicted Fe-Mo cluster-binding NifX family protein
MKIAISATNDSIDSAVDAVFGRCPYFLIVDLQDNTIQNITSVPNSGLKQTGAVGVSAVRTVAEQDVKAVISGNIGPHALDALKQFHITAYYGTGPIREVIEKFKRGELQKIT